MTVNNHPKYVRRLFTALLCFVYMLIQASVAALFLYEFQDEQIPKQAVSWYIWGFLALIAFCSGLAAIVTTVLIVDGMSLNKSEEPAEACPFTQGGFEVL